jgi:hypothetical protein
MAWWLLGLLEESKSPHLIPLFESLLTDPDKSFPPRAERGLALLDTKEARTILYHYRQRADPSAGDDGTS